MSNANDRGPVGPVAARLYRIGAPVAFLCMLALFAAGLGQAAHALWLGATLGFHAGIAALLKGIELLLLAPIVYLVLATMATLVVSVQHRLEVLNSPWVEHREASSKFHLDETFHLVHGVKQSVAALFVALLLTDFIARILNRDPLRWIEVAAQTAAMVIGVAYYAVHTRGAAPAKPSAEPDAAARYVPR